MDLPLHYGSSMTSWPEKQTSTMLFVGWLVGLFVWFVGCLVLLMVPLLGGAVCRSWTW